MYVVSDMGAWLCAASLSVQVTLSP